MLLRHEGKGCGNSPLEGEVGLIIYLRKSQPPMSFPTGVCASDWNLWEAVQKAKTYKGRLQKA